MSRFEEFKDEVDHIDFVIPSEFNLVAEKTILLPTMLSSLKKNDRYLGQKQILQAMEVSGVFTSSTLSSVFSTHGRMEDEN